MLGIWITHVRGSEIENQDFVPNGPDRERKLEEIRVEFRDSWKAGDTIEEFEGEG